MPYWPQYSIYIASKILVLVSVLSLAAKEKGPPSDLESHG